MINTVIFDLDGTLLYTLEDLADSANCALEKFGFEKRELSDIRTFVGNGVKKLMERCVPNGVMNPKFEECLVFFKKNYEKNMYNKTAPYQGILDLLDNLESKGIKCAVVSNKFDDAVKDLCKKYFGEKIIIAIGESENIRKKPAPDSVIEVIKKLGTRKENCVYVGDSEVDIETAKNAQIPCISVCWGYKDIAFLKKNGAKCIVDSAKALEETILKM